MKNLASAVVCCAVLVLAGCDSSMDTDTGGGPELPDVTGSQASGTAPATPEAEVNERGFVVTPLGQPACFGGAGSDCEGGVSFSIDQVQVDPPCTEFGLPPENRHTLLLHLRIATGSDMDVVAQVAGLINTYSFVEIGKDGVTRPTSFGYCADPSTNQLPGTYGPNQQYAGVIDLEVAEASGTIALQLPFPDENGQHGWEWTYPV